VRIGTRGSALALAQAAAVAGALGEPAEIVTITTAGDRNRAAGDKSRWTGALEEALLAGDIDLAVHSAKDVPGDLAPGTELVAAPPRADAADLLVGADGVAALPPGARVGTSALRRRAQLLALRTDLDVVEVRGNVDTRLRKLAAGEVEALVLARAGLDRLGLLAPDAVRLPGGGEVPAAVLGDPVFVPAPGQGVLAVQARAGDPEAREAAAPLLDRKAWTALRAERAAVRALGASCHTPVGVHASDGTLRGFAGLPDGSAWVLDELAGGDADPEAAGETLARRMLAAGAGELLAEAAAAAGAAGPGA
jgi:hydroxymethylbilane synthase